MLECSEAMRKATNARKAAPELAALDAATRNGILHAMADALLLESASILQANASDVAAAREKGTSEALIDRLALSEARISSMADGLRSLATLPDPLGAVLEERSLYNGIELKKIRVPLGVVAIIYEARPNVTADAAGICLKTANACILRGGSMAMASNLRIGEVLSQAAEAAGAPAASIQCIEDPSHAASDELMSLHGLIDLLIPRGGAGLIRHCVLNSKVPVIETGVGNCHIYVHEAADQDKALDIICNAKTQRPGVCNACESLLVDEAIADEFLPRLLSMLKQHAVIVHGDRRVCMAGSALAACEEDWGMEYLALEISVRVLSGLEEALAHIARYGTKHSECIVSEDKDVVDAFLTRVDAAAVYANCSTRFTDGGEFGLGAEIGISTQKLHARGPMGLEAMTSYKYVLRGEGQIRR